METIFKRKYRWTFEADFKDVNTGPIFVGLDKTTTDITQPFKSFTTTYYSVSINEGADKLYKLIALYYDFGSIAFSESKSSKEVMEKTAGNLGKGTLILHDGCGQPLEQWKFTDLWPQSVNFGELCYSSTDEVNIEVTWRFLDMAYEHLAGIDVVSPLEKPEWFCSNTMGLGKLGETNWSSRKKEKTEEKEGEGR